MRVEERDVNGFFLCVIYMGSHSEIKEIHSRIVKNGVVTEDIHLISQLDDEKMELKGNINGKPVNIYRPLFRPASAATKKVRFANDVISVSNGLDRMATPFAPMIMFDSSPVRKLSSRKRRRSRRNPMQRRRKTRRQRR